MNSQPSAVNNLNRLTGRYIKIIIITFAVGILLMTVFTMLSLQTLKDITILRQEMQTTEVTDQNLNALNRFVDANTQNIERIFDTFPHYHDMIDVLKTLEGMAAEYDPQAKVTVNANNPSKYKNQLQIPLRISLKASRNDLYLLLRELEKLPLIIEIATLELNTANSARYDINIGARLYVAEPFNQ